MKVIQYQFATEANYGTAEQPDLRQVFTTAAVPYSEQNLAFAKAEAYNGEVSVVDDPTIPQPSPSTTERLDALESAMLAMMGGMMDV